jgi:hypothetical protein
MHRDHLALVLSARQLLAVALMDPLQGPGRQQDRAVQYAVDRLAGALVQEQHGCVALR